MQGLSPQRQAAQRTLRRQRVSIALLLSASMFGAAAASLPALPPDAFARVGDQIISMDTFQASLHAGMRRKFYHGAVPPERLREYRKEVAQELVDRVLLLQEARRQGISPVADQVEQELERFAVRMTPRLGKEQVQQLREEVRASVEEENVLMQLRARVQAVSAPSEEEVRGYVQRYPDKFTTPARWRLSMILLKVEPSAGAALWKAAEEEAGRLLAQLSRGANFAELARIHSGDTTGQAGGDLGYVHEGMLALPAEEAVKSAAVGAVTKPVVLLQGVALFKVEEYIAPQRNDFSQIASRAHGLLLRERHEQAWQRLLERLRASTPITLKEESL